MIGGHCDEPSPTRPWRGTLGTYDANEIDKHSFEFYAFYADVHDSSLLLNGILSPLFWAQDKREHIYMHIKAHSQTKLSFSFAYKVDACTFSFPDYIYKSSDKKH